jgi:hypothetical protein
VLEQGRGVLWAQTLDTRRQPDLLRARARSSPSVCHSGEPRWTPTRNVIVSPWSDDDSAECS